MNKPSIKPFDFFAGAQNILRSYAGVSSFFFYYPGRTLFDCGPGITAIMGQNIFAVESIYLSHCHFDHIGGLREFVLAREKFKGDTDKPIDIYTAEPEKVSEAIGNFGLKIVRIHHYTAFEGIEIFKDHFVVPIPSGHTKHSHIFSVIHISKKITEAGMVLVNEKRFDELKANSDKYHTIAKNPVFGYLLDCPKWNKEWNRFFKGAQFLIHDCTFLQESDRKMKDSGNVAHMTLKENLKLVEDLACGLHLFGHISHRYPDVRTLGIKLPDNVKLVSYHEPIVIVL